ncbi:AKNA factor, partial [Psilopogon haemacephalus]|nr:AKNA factor [Psilopogon haemacephalus]
PLPVPSLQEDYHKLLTKYAEAENTIDQLRLAARVSLYTDPPQPSRSLAVGSMGTGCQVMALSIPQARTAAFSMAPATASPASPSGAAGPSGQEASPQSPSSPPPGGCCPTCLGPCCCSGSQLTQTLAGQTQKLQAQASPRWTCGGRPWRGQPGSALPLSSLVPQRLRKLKDAQDALERAYLGARQQHPDSLGGFDPDRSVEGEVFRLGLQLEELKERLEPGARRQLPPQPPAQPHSPPAHSPPPTPSSLHPETEGPRGTVGDSKAVPGWLPRPLWNKQQRLEEDFGDLLQQYKHFKSLPESLSLEQLSLAESVSQEEVDGPVAGDGGPSKGGPRRTWSLEEGADLEISPLHPPARRAVSPTLGGTLQPGRTRDHHLPTAEEPPATAEPNLPRPLQPAGSSHSIGAGSTVSQHQTSKVKVPICSSIGVGSTVSQHCSGNVPTCQHPQGVLSTTALSLLQPPEQRIVSPETDSGFVGSEASRVSPPVHTPEHQPPGSRTPGLLGPSIPIPATLHPCRKREETSFPSKTTPTGIYPTGGQGSTGAAHLPPSTPWQSSSPHRWAESAGSEMGHGVATPLPWPGAQPAPQHPPAHRPPPCCPLTHHPSMPPAATCSAPGGSASEWLCAPCPPPLAATGTPTEPSPQMAPTSAGGPSLCLLSCGSQAIRALRDEVWRLQRRLEESLRRSHSYPEGKATPLPATLPRRQPRDRAPSSPKDAASSG